MVQSPLFRWKVPESGVRVKRHRIHVAWSPVWSFHQSVMIWAAMSSAGVGPLCFLKSTVNTAIYQHILKHFMLPSADKLYGDADFIFQQDLAPAHTAKSTKSWCYCAWLASKLAWPKPHKESMGYCQEKDERHQTQQCRWMKLILEWSFIVASLRHTCAIIMLYNQHLDMPHLWDGCIISAKEKFSLS